MTLHDVVLEEACFCQVAVLRLLQKHISALFGHTVAATIVSLFLAKPVQLHNYIVLHSSTASGGKSMPENAQATVQRALLYHARIVSNSCGSRPVPGSGATGAR